MERRTSEIRTGSERVAYHFHNGRGLLIGVLKVFVLTPVLLHSLNVLKKKEMVRS